MKYGAKTLTASIQGRTLYSVSSVPFILSLPLFLFLPSVSAQSLDDSLVRLSEANLSAQRGHLVRVGIWGAANLAGGGLLWGTAEKQSTRRAFGMQSAAWGAINLGIAVIGGMSGGEVGEGWSGVLGSERFYHDVLLVNLGLNAGYMMAGTAMVMASGRGVTNASSWRGHGWAVIVQGLGLMVLDGIAFAGSRGRLGELVELRAGAEGLSLVLMF